MSEHSEQIEQLNQMTSELVNLREQFNAQLAEIVARMEKCRQLAERFGQQVDLVNVITRKLVERLQRPDDPADWWKQST